MEKDVYYKFHLLTRCVPWNPFDFYVHYVCPSPWDTFSVVLPQSSVSTARPLRQYYDAGWRALLPIQYNQFFYVIYSLLVTLQPTDRRTSPIFDRLIFNLLHILLYCSCARTFVNPPCGLHIILLFTKLLLYRIKNPVPFRSNRRKYREKLILKYCHAMKKNL